MSRAYRIRISESVSKVIHVHDGLSAPVDLLPILPKEQMLHLLGAELEKVGWTSSEGKVTKDFGGVTAEVDLMTGQISLRIEREETATETAVVVRQGYDDVGPATTEASVREEAVQKAERLLALAKTQAQANITALLEAALPEVKAEIDAAANKICVTALKVKASQLGEIEEISESENGLAIIVKM